MTSLATNMLPPFLAQVLDYAFSLSAFRQCLYVLMKFSYWNEGSSI